MIGCCCFGACPPSSETYGGKGDRVAAVDRDAIILTEMSAAFFCTGNMCARVNIVGVEEGSSDCFRHLYQEAPKPQLAQTVAIVPK